MPFFDNTISQNFLVGLLMEVSQLTALQQIPKLF